MRLALLLFIFLASLVLEIQLVSSQEQGATFTYPAKSVSGNGQTCPLDEERERVRNQINGEIRMLLQNVFPTCGGDGWTRVAYLNMADPTQNCPAAWREYFQMRSCGRRNGGQTCDAVTYDTLGIEYTRVCGRVRGYQYGHTDAFWSYNNSPDRLVHFDGVIVTYGPQENHIWTFAAGQDEVTNDTTVCPCANPNNPTPINVPPYIGNNYFCEAGTEIWRDYIFYANDALWDGQGCGPNSNCCKFNNPPWFNVELPAPTTDDIVVKICGTDTITREDVAVELLELYVQ